MPDAYGNFKGIAVNPDAWERIFGKANADNGCARKTGPCPWGYESGCPMRGCASNGPGVESVRGTC